MYTSHIGLGQRTLLLLRHYPSDLFVLALKTQLAFHYQVAICTIHPRVNSLELSLVHCTLLGSRRLTMSLLVLLKTKLRWCTHVIR